MASVLQTGSDPCLLKLACFLVEPLGARVERDARPLGRAVQRDLLALGMARRKQLLRVFVIQRLGDAVDQLFRLIGRGDKLRTD